MPATPPHPPDTGLDLDRQRQALWRYLQHLGADVEAAADLAQAALVVWWQRRDDVPQLQVGAFLRATGQNLWRNELRRRGRQLEVAWADQVDALWAARPGPDERLARLRRCREGLGRRAREAVDAAYFEGLGRAAIGARLGLSEDGVKSLLRRAREALARCVRAETAPPSPATDLVHPSRAKP